jgi:membrane-associated phospholipid phosphatase
VTANQNQRPLVLIIACVLFAALLALVRDGATNTIDMAIHNWALNFNTPTTVMIWEDVSFMGSAIVISALTLLSIGASALRKEWRTIEQIILAMSGAVALNAILKWLVQRPRPVEIYAHTLPDSYSFPSGHAIFSFTFYLTIAAILTRSYLSKSARSVWAIAVVIVVLIGASRITLGVHYISDVIGGYLVAAIWMLLILILNRGY